MSRQELGIAQMQWAVSSRMMLGPDGNARVEITATNEIFGSHTITVGPTWYAGMEASDVEAFALRLLMVSANNLSAEFAALAALKDGSKP